MSVYLQRMLFVAENKLSGYNCLARENHNRFEKIRWYFSKAAELSQILGECFMNDEISYISEIKTFEHEKFGQIRFVNVIYKDVKREDESWFAAVDLCRVLDIQNPRDAVSRLDDDEKMTVGITDGHSGKRGGAQFMNFVSEPGMYRLIFMSRKPEAKKFKRWVFHEVLPSIRRNGYYIAPQQEMIEIVGDKNFQTFKAKYPAGAVEVKKIIIDKYKTYYVILHIAEKAA